MRESESRIRRLFGHLHQGTLIERIREEWRAHIKARRTLWWQKQTGKRESVVFDLQPGLRMMLYFDSRLSREIYCGSFESKERQFINRYLRPGEIFVDVGANIGMFTLIASQRVGQQGRVYAFEPCSVTYSRLVGNVDLNGLKNVKCLQIALSDRSGESAMNVSLDGYDAWNSFAQPAAGNSFAQEKVCAARWDDFAVEHHLAGRASLMKIDVEGWESHVLSGGREFFGRPDAPVLQIEFTDEASQSAGTSCEALYRQLEALGYRMFIYEAKTRKLIPDPLRERYPYLNLFAVKQPEEVQARLE
ncbi:MAG: FkbM family methyltransferase [Deltaproteobacteria bacterium]|nr:FkbM family methyltransferase [Deltaproteobacteria bacterium]